MEQKKHRYRTKPIEVPFHRNLTLNIRLPSPKFKLFHCRCLEPATMNNSRVTQDPSSTCPAFEENVPCASQGATRFLTLATLQYGKRCFRVQQMIANKLCTVYFSQVKENE
jgi:hypothetical protein